VENCGAGPCGGRLRASASPCAAHGRTSRFESVSWLDTVETRSAPNRHLGPAEGGSQKP
jgi:hypothetical protein